MNGLIIGVEPIEQILDLLKTWEMRGKYTHIRGRIALIKKGTKTIVGFADLVDVLGPLSLNALRKNRRKHLPTPSEYKNGLGYKQTFAWVLQHVQRLPAPIAYKHPSGAVIWVKLPDTLRKQAK
jgi:hypothetical protein